MVYLFSQLMTLEVAFLSPYVPCSPCRMLAARSKALRVHARQGRDLGRFFFGVNLLLLGKSALALPGLIRTALQLGIRGQHCPPNSIVHGYLPLCGDPQQCCGF